VEPARQAHGLVGNIGTRASASRWWHQGPAPSSGNTPVVAPYPDTTSRAMPWCLFTTPLPHTASAIPDAVLRAASSGRPGRRQRRCYRVRPALLDVLERQGHPVTCRPSPTPAACAPPYKTGWNAKAMTWPSCEEPRGGGAGLERPWRPCHVRSACMARLDATFVYLILHG
jgi:hypothetical protein